MHSDDVGTTPDLREHDASAGEKTRDVGYSRYENFVQPVRKHLRLICRRAWLELRRTYGREIEVWYWVTAREMGTQI